MSSANVDHVVQDGNVLINAGDACEEFHIKTIWFCYIAQINLSTRRSGNYAIEYIHDAPVLYPTMHHFATEMCTCTFLLQYGALWDICLMHRGICEMGAKAKHVIYYHDIISYQGIYL